MIAATFNNSFYLVDRGCHCCFGFVLWKYDLNNHQCVLIANAEDGLPLIFVLQNTMAAMDHDGPSLPLDLKFPFQNKSILIKLNLINETTNQLGQQIKNNMQVKYKSIWFRISIWNVNIDLISMSKMNLNAVWNYLDDSNWIWQQWATIHVSRETKSHCCILRPLSPNLAIKMDAEQVNNMKVANNQLTSL